MSKVVIGVDSGKHSLKAVRKMANGEIKKIKFRTKMDDTKEDKSANKRSYVVTYDGKKNMLGELAEKVDYEKNKKKYIHKISAYTAIAKLLEPGEKNVVLSIGCPLSIFKNVEERKKYEEYFKSDGEISIRIDGEIFNFNIEKVIICPESSGVIFRNHKDYKNRMVGVIDIGGLNTNNCVYNRLNPISSTMFTTNLGSNILTNELKQTLNSTFPLANIQDWQMETIIAHGYIKSNKEESTVLIRNFFKKHMENILDECKRKGWDLSNLDLVFVGGGSILLEKEIINFTPPETYISEDAEWDNAFGFEFMGSIHA